MKSKKSKKLRELLYDIRRQKDYDDIHNLIIKYSEEAKDKQQKTIVIRTMNIEARTRKEWPTISLTFNLPPELLKHDSWVIDNVLKELEK